MLLAARQSHQCHSLKNYLRVPKQWLKKKTNFRDNLFFIVGDMAHAPVINNTHLLTNALLSWGLVPVIPRSFHYWQPAPRWRPLPESPRGREESRHPSHWEHQWKGRGGTPFKLSHNVCDTPTLNKAHKSCHTHQNGWGQLFKRWIMLSTR